MQIKPFSSAEFGVFGGNKLFSCGWRKILDHAANLLSFMAVKKAKWGKIKIFDSKLKTFLEPGKVFRDSNRVLLDPNDTSSTFFTFWIKFLIEKFSTSDSPKNESVRRSKKRQIRRYFLRFSKNYRSRGLGSRDYMRRYSSQKVYSRLGKPPAKF